MSLKIQAVSNIKPQVKKDKGTSNGRRHKVRVVRSDIYKGPAEKSLVFGIKRQDGRGAGGQISVRHKGGASHKKNQTN